MLESMKLYALINICMITGLIALGMTQGSIPSAQEELMTEAADHLLTRHGTHLVSVGTSF